MVLLYGYRYEALQKTENFILIIDKTATLKCITVAFQSKISFDGIPSHP